MRFSGRFIQFALPLLFIGLQNPTVASAGALSLLSSLFSKAEAQHATAMPVYQGNSQTAQLLSAAKHRDPNPSRGGGDIAVTDGALVAESAPGLGGGEHQHGSGEISVYIVRAGDSLSQIASMFNVSVNTIMWANDLKRGVPIHEGQTLLILPISGIQHTVVKGETIAKIAKQYGGDEAEILQYNGLASSEDLVVGTTITIPGGEEVAPAAVVSKPVPAASAKVGVTTKSTKSVANGYYTHPVPGAVKTQGIHGYNAVDLGAPIGTSVYAAAPGVVIVSREGGWNGGYGNYIVISHPNGTQTLYAHLSKILVSEGSKVSQGQNIGAVGSTGKSTGPHLHFEVRGAKNPF